MVKEVLIFDKREEYLKPEGVLVLEHFRRTLAFTSGVLFEFERLSRMLSHNVSDGENNGVYSRLSEDISQVIDFINGKIKDHEKRKSAGYMMISDENNRINSVLTRNRFMSFSCMYYFECVDRHGGYYSIKEISDILGIDLYTCKRLLMKGKKEMNKETRDLLNEIRMEKAEIAELINRKKELEQLRGYTLQREQTAMIDKTKISDPTANVVIEYMGVEQRLKECTAYLEDRFRFISGIIWQIESPIHRSALREYYLYPLNDNGTLKSHSQIASILNLSESYEKRVFKEALEMFLNIYDGFSGYAA